MLLYKKIFFLKILQKLLTRDYKEKIIKKKLMKEITPLDVIKSKIHTIRGKQVIIDSDLAELYRVETESSSKEKQRTISRKIYVSIN
jgi:SOS response regulatory protein OraA/RecX